MTDQSTQPHTPKATEGATRVGSMATDRAQRYAKQLMSHWSSRGVLDEGDDVWTLTWPDGRTLKLRATPDALVAETSVPAGDDLDRFCAVVKVHLERFGQREELTLTWVD